MKVTAQIVVRVDSEEYPAGYDEVELLVGASVEHHPHHDGEYRVAGRTVVEGEEGIVETWSDLTTRQQASAEQALIDAFEAAEEKARQARRTPAEQARWAKLEEAADVPW